MAVTYPQDPCAKNLDLFMSTWMVLLSGTLGGLPERMVMFHGSVPPIDLPGMGWIRDADQFVSTTIAGQPEILPTKMSQPFRWFQQIEVGVCRCVADIDADSGAFILPDVATIDAENAVIMSDKQALRSFWRLLPTWTVQNMMWGHVTNLNSEGGAGGCTMTISVPIRDCAPTIEDTEGQDNGDSTGAG
jgi:hypothetical protein